MRAVNLHEEKWEGASGVYVGRPSILGNPYPIGKQSRGEVVERYRTEWLWPIVEAGLAGRWAGQPSVLAEFTERDDDPRQRMPVKVGWPWGEDERVRQAVWEAVRDLALRAQGGERLALLCYCKPLACHADVLARGVRWLAAREDLLESLKPQT